MRRLNGTEKGGLALAGVLVIFGFCMIVHPIDMAVPHAGWPRYAPGGGTSPTEHVSKRKARYFGGAAVLLGAGFTAFVLYRPRE